MTMRNRRIRRGTAEVTARPGQLSDRLAIVIWRERCTRWGVGRCETAGMFDRLHLMQLAMSRGEEDSARQFYIGVLGMSEIDKSPVLADRGGAWFRCGGVELHLGVEDDFRPARKGHPGILISDLDEIARQLQAAGQTAQWDDDLRGFRRAYAHDPFGHRLEFLEPSP